MAELKGLRIGQFKNPVRNPFIHYMGCLTYGFDRQTNEVVEHIRRHGCIGSYSLGGGTVYGERRIYGSRKPKRCIDQREVRRAEKLADLELRKVKRDPRRSETRQAKREAFERLKQIERERIAEQEWKAVEAKEAAARAAEGDRVCAAAEQERKAAEARESDRAREAARIVQQSEEQRRQLEAEQEAGRQAVARHQAHELAGKLEKIIFDLGRRNVFMTAADGRRVTFTDIRQAILTPSVNECITPASAQFAIQLYYAWKARGCPEWPS